MGCSVEPGEWHTQKPLDHTDTGARSPSPPLSSELTSVSSAPLTLPLTSRIDATKVSNLKTPKLSREEKYEY